MVLSAKPSVDTLLRQLEVRDEAFFFGGRGLDILEILEELLDISSDVLGDIFSDISIFDGTFYGLKAENRPMGCISDNLM